MARYCIVAAKPKGTGNHLKSQFKVLKEDPSEGDWVDIKWKSIFEIAAFLQAGDQVLTGRLNGTNLDLGEPVELELRIARNKRNFDISTMPDT